MDEKLLRAFARRSEVYEAGQGPWTAEELAYEEWVTAGSPQLDGLPPADAAVLAERPLTVKLAAKRERVSERTIYRWLTSGELAAHRAGRGWRINPSDLDRRRVEASKPKPKPDSPAKRRTRRRKAASTPSGRVWPS
jgi:excisionase family DNA binding protein